jgi:hypothetical protein
VQEVRELNARMRRAEWENDAPSFEQCFTVTPVWVELWKLSREVTLLERDVARTAQRVLRNKPIEPDVDPATVGRRDTSMDNLILEGDDEALVVRAPSEYALYAVRRVDGRLRFVIDAKTFDRIDTARAPEVWAAMRERLRSLKQRIESGEVKSFDAYVAEMAAVNAVGKSIVSPKVRPATAPSR